MIMRNNKIRSSLVVALAAAVTLTSFNLSPAQAAPKSTAPQVSKSVVTDISARRRHYRNAAALAMFGLVAGGIAAAAAADRYNDGYYYGGGPYYGGGYYRGGWGDGYRHHSGYNGRGGYVGNGHWHHH
jgi:hypothetical protein